MKTLQTLLVGLIVAISSVSAWGAGWSNETYTTVTITTDVFTTICDSATTFGFGTKTYTATASETITIEDCSCTHVYTTSLPVWGSSAKPTITASPSPSTIYSNVTVFPLPTSNGSVPEVWTTTTISTEFTTVCPTPTTFTRGESTYSVTGATTLTLTETLVLSTLCPSNSVPTWTTTTLSIISESAPTSAPSGSLISPPISNGTLYTYPGSPTGPETIYETISILTTYCATETTLTLSSPLTDTIIVTLSSGTNTIPIVSPKTITPIGTPSSKIPVGPSKTPIGLTSSTTTGPAFFTGAAIRFEAGAGALAAGLAALLL